MPPSTDVQVHLRGGVVVPADALRVLWRLEDDGFVVKVLDGRLHVSPRARLTPTLDAEIRWHRDELVRLVGYVADDLHLFSDAPTVVGR